MPTEGQSLNPRTALPIRAQSGEAHQNLSSILLINVSLLLLLDLARGLQQPDALCRTVTIQPDFVINSGLQQGSSCSLLQLDRTERVHRLLL